ncbi:radical SAM protein [Parabacteroides distasonis]|uniref:radical SAM/SPASM domain-containing protein n=1 Tax=Parabacteroides distasonis TaxID=823 RepID=UPI0018992870|nr:radical SAM protein [Parabacteroides distasonis]MDB8995957.1 radical SAM protein [Parabacteroides distasonis]MDB9071125.1 radical SAM protein [Parabacteroides distasonis]
MRQSGSVNSDDRFFFPGEVIYHKCDEGWLAICIEAANWIVLTSDLQRQILEDLTKGSTIGHILEYLSSDEIIQLQKLLAAITAREFARTDKAPKLHLLEGNKLLNCYLTNACNLRCEHCFMSSGVRLKNELSTDEWNRVLSEFRNCGGESVTFSGGEPMMRPDLQQIVMNAHNINLNTTILTNGILWTDRQIHQLSPYITEVQVSIDGFDEMSNAKIRGEGNFNKLINTVVAFANEGVQTSVATTFTFANLCDNADKRYKQMVEDIKSRCDNPVFFKLSKKVLQGRNTHYSEEENKAFYNRILEIECAVDPNAQLENFMEGHTPNLVTRNCGFGGISIGADGEVYYCNRISEVESYGNIRNLPIKHFMSLGHELHQRTSVDHLVPCKNCYLRNICFGGCRIDDCSCKGKVKDLKGNIIQNKCNKEFKQRLIRRMIESYFYYYTF